jgi:acetylornithine aminotransferase
LAVAATDNKNILAPVNETDNIVFLPFNDEAALQAYFNEHGNEVSSVIIEGIQGVGGINVANNSFLQLIRNLCDQYNAVYIADSVQCGYGRTGKFFAHDFAGVNADIYSLAKGMGNGFPIGGILIAPHLKPKHGMLGTTFGGNPLACAAAMAVLNVINDEQLINKANELGTYLMEELSKIDGIINVRGRGLMVGFEMTEDLKDLKKQLLFDKKVFTGEAKPNVIRLLPSLAITKEQIDVFLQTVRELAAIK